MSKQTILLYGRTGSGKTTLIGELAEDVKRRTGKNTRLATADRGGNDTIQPYVDLGIIQLIPMVDTDPFIFLNKVVRGYVRNEQGRWVMGDNSNIGLFAFESMRAFAEALMATMARKSGEGTSIGGGSNISFIVQGDSETVKISGSNMAHFGVTQSRITEEVWESQKLPGDIILWTSSVSKDDDGIASGKVLGPDVIGKALTSEVPRWFSKTFRVDVLPASGGKEERHLLYLGTHADMNAGNATAAGNIRMPLDAPKLVKNIIEPASLVEALKVLEGGKEKALEVIKKRLGAGAVTAPLRP